MKKSLFLVLILLTSAQLIYSQNILISKSYPTDFRPPLAIAPSLAATFGEIRPNHFHSGLDYRTNQREGYPVYAVADGFISRLRVQSVGYGNAIYINHPNGYTTVYGHLQRFNQPIATFVKSNQYQKQSFEIDSTLSSTEIPVKKGDIIGWSGNTGSSGGPHLHFEVRDSKTEEALNPQLFGLEVPDKVKPVISGLYVYRLAGLPFSENTSKQYFPVTGVGGHYRLSKPVVIKAESEEIAFGIAAFDQQTVGGNQNGIYSIELLLDGTTIYAATLEGFHFDNSRAINAYIDYPALVSSGKNIQKSFVEPGNPLTIYKTLVNQGIIDATTDDLIHNMQYIVKDVQGNSSTLNFQVKFYPIAMAGHLVLKNEFDYNRDNAFTTEDVKITIPSGALYSNIGFDYSKSSVSQGFSPVHHIHNRLIPVHIPYSLSIKPNPTLSPTLYEKALIVDSKGTSQGGVYENGWIKTTLKTFGSFYVGVDTIAPSIKPANVTDGKMFNIDSKMIFKIKDDLSGIASFTGTIDGQWILMEYDAKTNTLWHTFDGRISAGKHHFQLVVTDTKSNSSTFNATININ